MCDLGPYISPLLSAVTAPGIYACIYIYIYACGHLLVGAAGVDGAQHLVHELGRDGVGMDVATLVQQRVGDLLAQLPHEERRLIEVLAADALGKGRLVAVAIALEQR